MFDISCIVFGTNTTYLSNTINEYFGCNLKTLLNRYRIEYAKQMLRARKCSIKDLPGLCGFASRSAFYVSFQKMEGTTPLHYMLANSYCDASGQIDSKNDINRVKKLAE